MRPRSAISCRCRSRLVGAVSAVALGEEYAFGAAALAFAERALRRDADFLDPGPPRRRLDRLHQSRHLRRERAPGQKGAGIDNQKQKPVILHLAARDRRAGEEAQGLDRDASAR